MLPLRGVTARRDRAGNAAFASLTILTLLGFGALAVDVGQARKAHAELQNTVDAAAHAAVLDLDFSTEGLESARTAAEEVAMLNTVDGVAVELSEGDVVFGSWDDEEGVFTASSDPEEIDAVVVSHRIAVSAVFGLVAFGVETLSAGASGMAVVPAPEPASAVSCYLPIAVPYCRIDGPGIFDFVASSNPNDTAGWAALPGADGTTPTADFLKRQLSGSQCADAEIGTAASVMNGTANSVTAAALERINGGPLRATSWTSGGLTFEPPDEWPAEEWPDRPALSEQISRSGVSVAAYGSYGIAGPVMLVSKDADGDGEDDFCDDDDGDGIADRPPNWNGQVTLEGFAYAMIYDGRPSGGGVDATLRIRVNTARVFDDYVTATGGHAEYGLGLPHGPRVLPTP